MGKAYRQPKIDTNNKTGSLAFFLAIPCSVIIGMLLMVSIYSTITQTGINHERWVLFLFGLVCAVGMFATKSLQTIKTIIHEGKHAALVILSGNQLTEFKWHRGAGHVSYQLYNSRKHIAPFIILAPYFFPFFSLPVLTVAIVINLAISGNHDLALSAVLGFTLGTDLITSWQEFHPYQTDLQRVSGGILAVYFFIVGTNFLWIANCLIWVQSAVAGYVHFAEQSLAIVLKLASG